MLYMLTLLAQAAAAAGADKGYGLIGAGLAAGLALLVLGLALLLQGCAGLIPGKESIEAPPAPSRAPAAPAGGSVEIEKGRPGLVIAAPHGTSDAATDVMGRDLARLTGFGLVVVTGYTRVDGAGRRYNVNRPTESAPGASTAQEVETAAARDATRWPVGGLGIHRTGFREVD